MFTFTRLSTRVPWQLAPCEYEKATLTIRPWHPTLMAFRPKSILMNRSYSAKWQDYNTNKINHSNIDVNDKIHKIDHHACIVENDCKSILTVMLRVNMNN